MFAVAEIPEDILKTLKERARPGVVLPRSSESDRGRLLCLIAQEPNKHVSAYAIEAGVSLKKFSSALSGLRETRKATLKDGQEVGGKVALVCPHADDLGKTRNFMIQLSPLAFISVEELEQKCKNTPEEFKPTKPSWLKNAEFMKDKPRRHFQVVREEKTEVVDKPKDAPEKEVNHIQISINALAAKRDKFKEGAEGLQEQITNLVGERDKLEAEAEQFDKAMISLYSLLGIKPEE